MGIIAGDLLQIIDTQTYYNQVCLNVYYYRKTAGDNLGNEDYPAIVADFITRVVTPVRAIQGARVTHTGISVRNLSNAVDFYEEAVSLVGTFTDAGASNDEPTFMANAFRLIRSDLNTRNGYKRYVGVTEGMVSSGASILNSTLTNAVIAGLIDLLEVDAAPELQPIIVKRPIATPAGAYVYSIFLDAQYRGVTTQNTRKVGRGI